MRRWNNLLDAYTSQRIDRCVTGLRQRFAVEQMREFEIGPVLARLAGCQTAIGTDDTVLIDGFHIADARHEITLAIFEHQYLQRRRVLRGQVTTEAASTLHELVLIDLPMDVGRVLIRPETLGDKVSPWFAQRELAFDHPPMFGERYYVLAENDERARQGLPARFLQTVCETDRMVVEIEGTSLAAMRLRPLPEDDQSALVGLAFEMRRAWK